MRQIAKQPDILHTLLKTRRDFLAKQKRSQKEQEACDMKIVSDGPEVDEFIWDVLTGLRGPDLPKREEIDLGILESLDLKRLTTGRIRGILETGVFGVSREEPLSDTEIEERNRLLQAFNSPHFETHFKKALYALKFLGFKVPDAENNFRKGRFDNQGRPVPAKEVIAMSKKFIFCLHCGRRKRKQFDNPYCAKCEHKLFPRHGKAAHGYGVR